MNKRLFIYACFIFAGFSFFQGAAVAHQSSISYGDFFSPEDVGPDDSYAIAWSLSIHNGDLFEALSLATDRPATEAEIIAGAKALGEYVASKTKFEAVSDGPCAPAAIVVTPKTIEQTLYANITQQINCQSEITAVNARYELFFDLDPLHVSAFTFPSDIRGEDGETKTFQFTHAQRDFNSELTSPNVGIFTFIKSGIEHIIYGLDHILFLFSLLCIVVISWSNHGVGRSTFAQSISETLKIVTTFTVAHSITLIVAGLGWVSLPGPLVESIIAASIVFVAIDNLRDRIGNRIAIVFLFGLVHGLGFASMLRPLLPAQDIVVPLLSFNVGVELGQLAIVLIVLPIFYFLAKQLGAPRYKRFVIRPVTVLLVVIGCLWFVERAFQVKF